MISASISARSNTNIMFIKVDVNTFDHHDEQTKKWLKKTVHGSFYFVA